MCWSTMPASCRSRRSPSGRRNARPTPGARYLAGVAVFGLVLLIRNIRQGLVRWKPAMAIGGAAAALLTLNQLLQLELTLKNYPTSVPFQTFQIGRFATVGMAALFGFIFFGLRTGALYEAGAVGPERLSTSNLPSQSGQPMPAEPRELWPPQIAPASDDNAALADRGGLVRRSGAGRANP